MKTEGGEGEVDFQLLSKFVEHGIEIRSNVARKGVVMVQRGIALYH